MMQIAAWLVIGWIFACCVAAFVIAFVHPVLPEIPSREYADEFVANLSGSYAANPSDSFAPEPERALPAARNAVHSRAAGTRHLKIVP